MRRNSDNTGGQKRASKTRSDCRSATVDPSSGVVIEYRPSFNSSAASNPQESSERDVLNSFLAENKDESKDALIRLILKLRVGALKNRSVSKFVGDQYKQDKCSGIITILNNFKETYNQGEGNKKIEANNPLQLIDELTKRTKKEKKLLYPLRKILLRSKENSITERLSESISCYANNPLYGSGASVARNLGTQTLKRSSFSSIRESQASNLGPRTRQSRSSGNQS